MSIFKKSNDNHTPQKKFETLGTVSFGSTESGTPEVQQIDSLTDAELLEEVKSGDLEAKVEFGRRLLVNACGKQTRDAAFVWLDNLVEFEESVEAAGMLLDVFRNGLYGFQRDDEKAKRYFTFLVQHNDLYAIATMADDLVRDGYREAAHVWYYRAAMLGDAHSHIAYACGLYDGLPEGDASWSKISLKQALSEFALNAVGMSESTKSKNHSKGEAELWSVARKYSDTFWGQKAEELIDRFNKQFSTELAINAFLRIVSSSL